MSAYRLTLDTSSAVDVVEGDATPSPSADGRLRVEWSTDGFGRGAAVTIQPLTADSQFVLHSFHVTVVPSLAGPDEA